MTNKYNFLCLLNVICLGFLLLGTEMSQANNSCRLGDYTYDGWGGTSFRKDWGYIQYFDPTAPNGCPDIEYPLSITSFHFRTQGGTNYTYLWPKYPAVVVYDMADPSDICAGPGDLLATDSFQALKDLWDDNIGEFTFPQPLKVDGPFFIGVINIQPNPDGPYFPSNFSMNWCNILLPDCHIAKTLDRGQTWFSYLQADQAGWQLEWWVEVSGDRDGDGLLDDWETNGIDVNNDGMIDLDLPTMGADPDRKDLFIEVDRMAFAPFSQNSIDMVETAFAQAPLNNPDNSTGIELHVIIDEMIPLQHTIDDQFFAFDVIKATTFGTIAERSSSNWPNIKEAKKKVFRYCLFANCQNSGAVGRGETLGNDFIISHGCSTHQSDRSIAITFMHELGHNLGLYHGGADNVNYKPNYVSVMNYGFREFTSVRGAPLPIDYSREAIMPLDEQNLDETIGILSSQYPAALTLHGYLQPGHGLGYTHVLLNGSAHDWNQNSGLEVGVAVDLNWMGNTHPTAEFPSPSEIMNSYNDWDLIVLPIGTDGEYADSVHNTVGGEEITGDILVWHDAHFPDAPVWSCRGDRDIDGDVDGKELAHFTGHPEFLGIEEMAAEFGNQGCSL